MSGRWFRLYDDWINDPKILQLSWSFRGKLVGLWCISSKNDGKLPQESEISAHLRLRLSEVRELLRKLCNLGLIDNNDNGLSPHNWDRRQFKSDQSDPTHAERQKRYRDGKRTRHAYDQKQTTEVEKGKIPLGNFPRSLPAERVTSDAAEAAASGGSLGGSPPAAAAEAERPPEAERRAQIERLRAEGKLTFGGDCDGGLANGAARH